MALTSRSPLLIGLLQALGLVTYASLVALLMFNANSLFGRQDSLAAPILFLSLFMVSALICSFIAFAYPFQVFWHHKNPHRALRILGWTTGFLFVIVSSIIAFLIATR